MGKSGFQSGSIGTVSGVFFSKSDADNAYKSLIGRGHTPDDIAILMSDETLNKYQAYGSEGVESQPDGLRGESTLSRAGNLFTGIIISITSMISLPGLGIAISKRLQRRIPVGEGEEPIDEKEPTMTGSGISGQDTDSYSGHMQEGGIIVSVDPRNEEEKRAIIKEFRLYNGQDILGDDGYTELD